MTHSFGFRLLASLPLLVLVGCAGGRGPGLPTPRADVLPGFDTRVFPGEDALRVWREASPYRWVGYYLPAPCQTGRTWVGRRAALERMGWGIAVLFIGEQDWPARAGDSTAVAADGARCTRENLTPDNGAVHAREAEAAAGAEGFAAGTIIYLDVERVEQVSQPMADYVAAWTGALLDGGVYVPGLYAHERNAAELVTRVADEFNARGRSDAPRLWVVRPAGFALDRSLGDSGVPDVSIWQGLLDTPETWGGVTLTIDANLARADTPGLRGR